MNKRDVMAGKQILSHFIDRGRPVSTQRVLIVRLICGKLYGHIY